MSQIPAIVEECLNSSNLPAPHRIASQCCATATLSLSLMTETAAHGTKQMEIAGVGDIYLLHSKKKLVSDFSIPSQ